MKFASKMKFVYLLSLFVFTFIYLNFKPKPKISEIILNDEKSLLYSNSYRSNFKNLEPLDNKVAIKNSLYFIDGPYWYQIYALSFWKKEYLNIKFVDKFFQITDLKIKNVKNNNFAMGNYNNEKVVYACTNSSKDFYYDIEHNKKLNTRELNYWKEVFLMNLDYIIYSFKPINYECLLVITSDTKLFLKRDKEIQDKVFNKFIDY